MQRELPTRKLSETTVEWRTRLVSGLDTLIVTRLTNPDGSVALVGEIECYNTGDMDENPWRKFLCAVPLDAPLFPKVERWTIEKEPLSLFREAQRYFKKQEKQGQEQEDGD